MPFAVFVLGIAGAFSTVSMQSSDKLEATDITGYVDNNDGGSPCDLAVTCQIESTDEICRQFDDSGPEAKAMFPNETSCSRTVFRVDPE